MGCDGRYRDFPAAFFASSNYEDGVIKSMITWQDDDGDDEKQREEDFRCVSCVQNESVSTGAYGYNRPCAHGINQSCMVESVMHG